jgi:hypothetical protein
MKKPQLVRLGLQCLQGWEESAGEVTERIVALLPFEQSGRARQHLEGMVREVGRGHPPDPLFQTADAQAAVPVPHAISNWSVGRNDRRSRCNSRSLASAIFMISI